MKKDEQLREVIGKLIDLTLNMSARIDLLGDALTVIADELMRHSEKQPEEPSTEAHRGQYI